MTYTIITNDKRGSRNKIIDRIEADTFHVDTITRTVTFERYGRGLCRLNVALYNLDYVVKVYVDEVK